MGGPGSRQHGDDSALVRRHGGSQPGLYGSRGGGELDSSRHRCASGHVDGVGHARIGASRGERQRGQGPGQWCLPCSGYGGLYLGGRHQFRARLSPLLTPGRRTALDPDPRGRFRGEENRSRYWSFCHHTHRIPGPDGGARGTDALSHPEVQARDRPRGGAECFRGRGTFRSPHAPGTRDQPGHGVLLAGAGGGGIADPEVRGLLASPPSAHGPLPGLRELRLWLDVFEWSRDGVQPCRTGSSEIPGLRSALRGGLGGVGGGNPAAHQYRGCSPRWGSGGYARGVGDPTPELGKAPSVFPPDSPRTANHDPRKRFHSRGRWAPCLPDSHHGDPDRVHGHCLSGLPGCASRPRTRH